MFGRIRKIAVCLSGQARTWRTAKDNILKYYDLTEYGCQVDFFIHTWDTNQYRGKNDIVWLQRTDEKVSPNENEDLIQAFNPVAIEMEEYNKDNYTTLWETLLYSFMKSVWLKKKHEVENNFVYDLVIRARLDINYPQEGVCNLGCRLDKFHIHNVNHLTAYSTVPVLQRFPQEFNYPNFDDVFFYSNSPTMDIISNCCRWYRNVQLENMATYGANKFIQDSTYWYGPGTILYRYLVSNGIHPQGYRGINYYVVRKAVEDAGLNSIDNWRDICEYSHEWYSNILDQKDGKSVLDKYKAI